MIEERCLRAGHGRLDPGVQGTRPEGGNQAGRPHPTRSTLYRLLGRRCRQWRAHQRGRCADRAEGTLDPRRRVMPGDHCGYNSAICHAVAVTTQRSRLRCRLIPDWRNVYCSWIEHDARRLGSAMPRSTTGHVSRSFAPRPCRRFSVGGGV
jgi:hypothetical protein